MVGHENFMKQSYSTGPGNLDNFKLEYAFLNEFELYISLIVDTNLKRKNYQKNLKKLIKIVKVKLNLKS